MIFRDLIRGASWGSLEVKITKEPQNIELLLTVSGTGAIFTIDEPEVRSRVGHQHSQFCVILDLFVDYYSSF